MQTTAGSMCCGGEGGGNVVDSKVLNYWVDNFRRRHKSHQKGGVLLTTHHRSLFLVRIKTHRIFTFCQKETKDQALRVHTPQVKFLNR